MKTYTAPQCEEKILAPYTAMAASPTASMEDLTETEIDINWYE